MRYSEDYCLSGSAQVAKIVLVGSSPPDSVLAQNKIIE